MNSSERRTSLSAKRVHPGGITITGLTKAYGRFFAVDQLSFIVQPGRVTGFLGPNGTGKSTTLRILLGLIQATEGSALITGLAYAELDDPATTIGSVVGVTSGNGE